MRCIYKYVISPTDDLLAKAKTDEIFDLLCETIMIESEEGGRTFVRREEFRLRIKLFVLFNFYSEYASVPEMAEFFHGKEFNEALFDRLWTLKEVEEVIQFPKWSEKIQYTAPVPRLPQTDSEFVNRWLSEVVWFQAPPEQDNSYE